MIAKLGGDSTNNMKTLVRDRSLMKGILYRLLQCVFAPVLRIILFVYPFCAGILSNLGLIGIVKDVLDYVENKLSINIVVPKLQRAVTEQRKQINQLHHELTVKKIKLAHYKVMLKENQRLRKDQENKDKELSRLRSTVARIEQELRFIRSK